MSPVRYDKSPAVMVSGSHRVWQGWDDILGYLRDALRQAATGKSRWVAAIECYTGIHDEEVIQAFQEGLPADHWFFAWDAFKTESEINQMLAPYLGSNDPLFGYLSPLNIEAFLDSDKQAALQAQIDTLTGLVMIYGTGAAFCVQADTIIYADMPRWEAQLRQRRGEVSNLGVSNKGIKPSLQYKQSFFIDWRVCDRLKKETIGQWDFLLDTTIPDKPKMVTGESLRAGLHQTAQQPFRVVPFFDPAPWGGQWMREVCGLGSEAPNYGWCFDCVPEENSLLLDFGRGWIEIPSVNLIFSQPQRLLGDSVFGFFGYEFPIRFDFLDTMGGGNLSLQVHPLVEYIRDKFGMFYTQDESYYMLDAGADAAVYLGMKTGADPDLLFTLLEKAHTEKTSFDAEHFVNRWPAKKHDHFLIPAGTIHCSGADSMVLEISATPYLFTFKLWDWERLGLDGLPRPINLAHGRRNLQAGRDTEWTRANLINRVTLVSEGAGWREERTGLHELEFIETRRHWFTGRVQHNTGGTVNVLNLVQGAEAVVESPSGAFAPFVVHYAETFIVPASVGLYTIQPSGSAVGQECATLKAFVRLSPSAVCLRAVGSHL